MLPNTAEKNCQASCQTCVNIDVALTRLDTQRSKFRRFLHKYPHYSNFISDVCLDGWADEVNEVLHELNKSEERREKALPASSSSPKQSCRDESNKPPPKEKRQ